MKIDTELEDHFFWDFGRQGKFFIAISLVFFGFFGIIQEAYGRLIYEQLIWLWMAFPQVDKWLFSGVFQFIPEEANFIGIIPVLILFLICFLITYMEDVYLYGIRLSLWLVPIIIGISILWYYYINFWQNGWSDPVSLLTYPTWDNAYIQGLTIYEWSEPPNPFLLLFGHWEGWVNIVIILVINITGSFFGWQFKEIIRIYIKKEEPLLALSRNELINKDLDKAEVI
jgi:hypothetical protein